MAKRSKSERRADRAAKRSARHARKMERKAQRASKKDARRDDRAGRQAQRQEARSGRVSARQDARTDRTTARKAKGVAKVEAKSDAGYWSPEAVALRQGSLKAGIDTFGQVAGDAFAAMGGGGGEPDSIPSGSYGGGYDTGEDMNGDYEEDIPITEEPWFLPAVIAAGAGAIYVMTKDDKKKGRR